MFPALRTPQLPALVVGIIVILPRPPLLPAPRTPPPPALAEDTTVIARLPQLLQLQQLPQLQLPPQLALSPPGLAEGTTVTVPPTPLLPALAEDIAVIARLSKLQELPQLPKLPKLPHLHQLLPRQLALLPPPEDITVSPTPQLPALLCTSLLLALPLAEKVIRLAKVRYMSPLDYHRI